MRRALCAGLLILVALGALVASSGAASARRSAASPSANTIMITTSPAPLLIEVNGTPAMAPFSFSCVLGTNRTINAPSPQMNGSTRYTFLNWSDGGSQSHVISCAASGNYTAFFSREYAWSIDTNPSGLSVEVDGFRYTAPAVVWCLSGSFHGVTAPSPQGFNATRFVFMNWNDGGGAVHTLLCDSPRSLVAFFRTFVTILIFSNLQLDFVVQVDGIPHLLPHEIVCDFGTDRALAVPTPQTVSGAQWRFSVWSDLGPNPRTIRCDGPRNFTAIFERVDVTGPPQSLPDGVLIIGVVLGVVVFVVVVLVVAFRLISPKGAPPAAQPASPPGAGPPRTSTSLCPRCRSSAEAGWAYCMTCGEPLR